MKLGDYIKSKRGKRCMSLSELARQSGVAKGYISNLESGRHNNPTLDTLAKIASALDLSLSDMLKEMEQE